MAEERNIRQIYDYARYLDSQTRLDAQSARITGDENLEAKAMSLSDKTYLYMRNHLCDMQSIVDKSKGDTEAWQSFVRSNKRSTGFMLCIALRIQDISHEARDVLSKEMGADFMQRCQDYADKKIKLGNVVKNAVYLHYEKVHAHITDVLFDNNESNTISTHDGNAVQTMDLSKLTLSADRLDKMTNIWPFLADNPTVSDEIKEYIFSKKPSIVPNSDIPLNIQKQLYPMIVEKFLDAPDKDTRAAIKAKEILCTILKSKDVAPEIMSDMFERFMHIGHRMETQKNRLVYDLLLSRDLGDDAFCRIYDAGNINEYWKVKITLNEHNKTEPIKQHINQLVHKEMKSKKIDESRQAAILRGIRNGFLDKNASQQIVDAFLADNKTKDNEKAIAIKGLVEYGIALGCFDDAMKTQLKKQTKSLDVCMSAIISDYCDKCPDKNYFALHGAVFGRQNIDAYHTGGLFYGALQIPYQEDILAIWQIAHSSLPDNPDIQESMQKVQARFKYCVEANNTKEMNDLVAKIRASYKDLLSTTDMLEFCKKIEQCAEDCAEYDKLVEKEEQKGFSPIVPQSEDR